MSSRTSTGPGGQSALTLLAYGGLALPWSLASLPILTYLPAFYAKELRLSAGLVRAVFLAARLWDSLFDLIVGWLSDRSMSRFGRRKPWVLIAAPFLMAATWFLCNPPAGAGVIYLGIWSALFYTAWTAMGIPYVSWGAELSADYVERSRVTAYREVFTMIGNLLFASMPLIFLPPDAPLRQAMFLIAVTVLILVPLTTAPLGLFVRDPAPAQPIVTHARKELAALAKDRVLARFILATLSIWISNGVSNSLAVFSLGVGLQLPNHLFAMILVIYVAALSTLPPTLYISKRMEKHHLLIAAIALQALAYGVFLITPGGNVVAIAAGFALLGIGSAAWFILPTSMLADIIDHGEVASGERHSGAYVAIYNLAIKIGLALGVGLSFGLLELVDYDPSAAQYSVSDALNIRLLGYGLPGLLLVVAGMMLLKYPITKRVQHGLRAQIDARSAGAPGQWDATAIPVSRT